MAEKFLTLGASSFYGSNFAKLVEERGDKAIAYGHRLGDWLDMEPVDYIVNFASASLVAESWERPWDWMQVNGTDTTGLMYRAQGKCKRFIHVSTPEVYGSTPGWVTEKYTNWQPSTPYAVSRAAGDMMLKAYHRAYGFPMIITRTANIYGKGQQDYRIIPKALQAKLRGESLPLHGDGSSVRSFIHIRDACEATYQICKEGQVGETYHISTNKAHSIKEVVEMIGCKYEPATERLGKDQAYLLNSDKLRDMGWQDKITLEEGLCELSR